MGGIQDDEEPLLVSLDDVYATGKKKEIQIAILVFVVIGLGAINRVLSKIMTEPMENYSFFLTLFSGVAYVIFYGAILAGRYWLGKVPKHMLLFPFRTPKPSAHSPWWCSGGGGFWRWWGKLWALKYFVIIGFLDSIGNILGFIATPYVSGIMGSLATQTILLFAMPSAILILGTRYTIWQVMAAFAVLVGAMVAIMPDLFQSTNNGPLGYILLMVGSNIPSAISFTIKELVFKKEKNLELFVVNTTGSFFQLLWWPLMVPLTVLLNQTQGLPLFTYIRYGFMCFVGTTPPGAESNCGPMPIPYLVYIGINLLFNIFLLLLLKRASALQGFMALKAILPVSVFLFLIKWPLIGKSTLTLENTSSLVLILTGLILYRWATYEKEKAQAQLKD